VTIDRSTVSGATNTIVTNVGYTTRVGASKLSGGPVSGTVTCVQVYDENYAPTTCP
jgi:hypothetical protein